MKRACATLLPCLAAAAAPLWPVTWNMQQSTIVQPCSLTGWLNTTFFSQFGIVDVDWSNMKDIWVNTTEPMQGPGSDEDLLPIQCARLVAANPALRCFVYRNLVKAMPWYTQVRAKIVDPAYASWFLPFNPGGFFPNGSWHEPACDNSFSPPRCTALYHDLQQTPLSPGEHPGVRNPPGGNCPGPCDCGVPCGEYLWDHRNGSMLQEWFVNEFVAGPTGVGNPNVSGLFLDDYWMNVTRPDHVGKECNGSPIGGPSEEALWCVEDMGLSQADTTAITDGWAATITAVSDALIAAGKWTWQLFEGFDTPKQPECASALRSLCAAGANGSQYNAGVAHMFTLNGSTSSLPQADIDIATFLLVRGPYWWLGYGWNDCDKEYAFPDALRVDFGEPNATCAETAPGTGVFTRTWSRSVVTVDCNAYTGNWTLTE